MMNEHKKILLQNGSPEFADAAARLIYSTGDYLFDHVFGTDKHALFSLLSYLYKKRKGIFSYSFSTVARKKKDLIGLELGYTAADYKLHYIINFIYTVVYFRSPKIVKMFMRDRDVEKISAPIPREGYYIAHIAVAPYLRGKGISHILLENAFLKTKRLGFSKCCLDVASNNLGAIKFYKKYNFRIVKELKDDVLFKKYHLYSRFRMEKNII